VSKVPEKPVEVVKPKVEVPKVVSEVAGVDTGKRSPEGVGTV
jgi:hypothetical protein